MKPSAPPFPDQKDAAMSAHQRRCLASGLSKDKEELIRFVISPEGVLVADLYGKLGGRGAWVTAEQTHLDKAFSKNLFARHLKQKVIIKEDFTYQLADQFKQMVTSRLSMMRKTGQLLCGRGKLEMAAPRLEGLLIADDASARESTSLHQLVRPNWSETDLPASMLGQISGVESIAYAGVLRAGNPAEKKQIDKFLSEMRRWRALALTQKQQIRS